MCVYPTYSLLIATLKEHVRWAQSYPSVNTVSLACLYFGTAFVSLVVFGGGVGGESGVWLLFMG